MICHKCHGLMVQEASLHHRATESLLDQYDKTTLCARSYHCINCGSYTDSVIRRNKAGQRLIAHAETIATWADVALTTAVRA